jgi:hypothetical protein
MCPEKPANRLCRESLPNANPPPLRASVGSTDAPEKHFRGSMLFCTLVTLGS